MIGGLLLIAAALCLLCYNLWEEWRGNLSSAAALEQVREMTPREETWEFAGEAAIPDYLLNPEMEMPVIEVDGQAYIGVLSIPALKRELPVTAQWDDEKLKAAPCRFEGSAYLNNLIIAGHNYRSHFGGLKNLQSGDEITFTDAEGNRFLYEVTELEILRGNEIDRLKSGEWDLTLFTCTMGGENRVAVRCHCTTTAQ